MWSVDYAIHQNTETIIMHSFLSCHSDEYRYISSLLSGCQITRFLLFLDYKSYSHFSCTDSNIVNVCFNNLHFSCNLHIPFQIYTSVYLIAYDNANHLTTIAIPKWRHQFFCCCLLEAVLQLTLTVVFK